MCAERKTLIQAGLLIGAGMGGFVDGIMFHQLLQWHNMISGWLPPTNLVDTKVNMFWDGVFQVAVWMMTMAGILLMWRARAAPGPHAGRLLGGACIFGWGLFTTLEGLVNHLALGMHHVNDFAAFPLHADLAFQAGGALLLVVGGLMMRPEPVVTGRACAS